jgi:hypothetical protein
VQRATETERESYRQRERELQTEGELQTERERATDRERTTDRQTDSHQLLRHATDSSHIVQLQRQRDRTHEGEHLTGTVEVRKLSQLVGKQPSCPPSVCVVRLRGGRGRGERERGQRDEKEERRGKNMTRQEKWF